VAQALAVQVAGGTYGGGEEVGKKLNAARLKAGKNPRKQVTKKGSPREAKNTIPREGDAGRLFSVENSFKAKTQNEKIPKKK